jgi:hypothetical protein
MPAPQIKSLGKMTPRIDPKLAQHTSPPLPPRLRAARVEPGTSNGGAPRSVPAKLPPDLESPRKAPLPAGPPVDVAVQLWVEQTNDTSRHCPCFAHVSAPQEEQLTRLTVVYNLAWWPASGAIARGDQPAIKWLA